MEQTITDKIKALFLKKRNILILIFFTALITRLAYMFFFTSVDVIHADECEYNHIAMSIINGDGFYDSGSNRAAWAPGYPLFLSGVYLIFGQSYIAAKIIQCVIGALLCLIIFWIGEESVSPKVGVVAGFIAAFYYGLIDMSAGLLSETLFTFLLALSILHLLKTKNDFGFKNKLIAGALLGLATLTRPPTLIFPLFVLIWLIVARKRIKKAVVDFAIIFLAFLIPIVPWALRNYSIYHAFVPVSIHSGQVFWAAHNPHAPKGSAANIDGLEENTWYLEMPELERDRLYMENGWKFIKTLSVVEMVELGFLKLWHLFFPSVIIYDITLVLIFPFFLSGLFHLRKTNNIQYYILANFILITLIFYGSCRMRAPVSPYIITFASAGVINFCKKQRKSLVLVSLGLWLLFNAVIFILKLADYDFGLF